MKVQIKNGTITLPREIIQQIHLPKQDEWEIIAEKQEIKIFKKPVSKHKTNYRILHDLASTPVKLSINKMMKDELVDED